MKLMKIQLRRGDDYSWRHMNDAIDFALDMRISYIIHAERADGSPSWNFFSPESEEDIERQRNQLCDIQGCTIIEEKDLRLKEA